MSGRKPDLAFVEPAVLHLPETCQYHGVRILDTRAWCGEVAWGDGFVGPCCETGRGAFLRYFAARELGLPTIDAVER